MTKERFLIINADDYGMCHSTNQAIGSLLQTGAITSASLMMVCPWAKEAISYLKSFPQLDVGIHLTHTSEWEHYKWGPLRSDLSTLQDGFGYFPPDTATVCSAGDPEEIREEAIAQIELAMRMGLDLTNIDNHMGSMHHVTDILLDLCQTYNLPLRYPRHANPGLEKFHNESLVKQADAAGILLPDYVEGLPFFPEVEGEELSNNLIKTNAIQLIQALKPGITELLFHPSLDTEELKAITPTWQVRRFEFDAFRDEEVVRLLKEEDVTLFSWRELRKMQRA